MSSLILVKLTTSETILGKIDREFEDSIEIKNPVMFVPQPNKTIGIAPYMFGVKKGAIVKIYRSVIASVSEDVDTEIRNNYNQQFGNGIIVPQPGTINLNDFRKK